MMRTIDWHEQYDLCSRLATQAHKGQTDKCGAPYILHPIRVGAWLVDYRGESDDAASQWRRGCAGLLHDVIEDCPGWTYERLHEAGVYGDVIALVKFMTHEPGVRYKDYIESLAVNLDACIVKKADILDNSNLSRITAESMVRNPDWEPGLKRYLRAWKFLTRCERALREDGAVNGIWY